MRISDIPLIEVIDALGLDYKKQSGHEYRLRENGKLTDGWRFNTHKGLVSDLSGKGRAQGNNFSVVKQHLGLDNKEVIDWFSERFNIEQSTPQKKDNTIKDAWSNAFDCTQSQIEYLASRGVDYELVSDCVKSIQDGIACRIYNEDGMCGITYRRLTSDHKRRFGSVIGSNGDGLYMHEVDYSKKHLIVVEGLIDFLTIRQFDSNVVGLKNAKNGIEYLKTFASKFELYICNDNDESGGYVLENLSGISYRRLDLSQYGDCKDVNDMHLALDEGSWIVDGILGNSEYVSPITSTFQKLYERQEIIKRQGMLGRESDMGFINKRCDGIIQGHSYMIMGKSNSGKSKLSYNMVCDFLRRGKKIAYISLELSEVFCLMEIVKCMEGVKGDQMTKGHKPKENLYQNLTIIDNKRSIEEVEQVFEGEYDMVFIDYVQLLRGRGSGKFDKQTDVAESLQKIGIKTNTAVVSLSQINKGDGREISRGDYTDVSPKGAGEFFSCNDVIFLIVNDKDTGEIRLIIQKNKYGIAGKVHRIDHNLSINRMYDGGEDLFGV